MHRPSHLFLCHLLSLLRCCCVVALLLWSVLTGAEAVTIHFWWSFGMMNLGTLVFSVLTWYLGQILPGEYGIKRAWHFPCTAARQQGGGGSGGGGGGGGGGGSPPRGGAEGGVTEMMLVDAEGGGSSDASGATGPGGGSATLVEEAAPTDLDVRVRMRGLRKVYEKSSRKTGTEDVCVKTVAAPAFYAKTDRFTKTGSGQT